MRPTAAAVKAHDELAPLGLDCGPRRPPDSKIRAKGCEGDTFRREEIQTQTRLATFRRSLHRMVCAMEKTS